MTLLATRVFDTPDTTRRRPCGRCGRDIRRRLDRPDSDLCGACADHVTEQSRADTLDAPTTTLHPDLAALLDANYATVGEVRRWAVRRRYTPNLPDLPIPITRPLVEDYLLATATDNPTATPTERHSA